MDDTGLEPLANFPGKTPHSKTGGAESGAVAAAKLVFDPDLSRLTRLWPSLSEKAKGAILEIVKTNANAANGTAIDC